MSGWETRPPSELQMGNGTLLVTLDRYGEIEQLYSPHIDALQSRVGAFRTRVVLPRAGQAPELVSVGPEAFQIRVRLATGTQVMQAEYQRKGSQLRLLRTLGLHPTEPVMLDSWEVLEGEAGLFHESVPWFGHSTSANCSLFHPAYNALVHHRGRRWLGIAHRGELSWVRVGHLPDGDRKRMWDGERIYAPVGAPDLGAYPGEPVRAGWDQVVQGTGTFGAFATAPARKLEFFVLCGQSERHLGEMLERVRSIESTRFFSMIEGMVARRHAPAHEILERIGSPRVRSLAERSIDVLHALQDADTGALMAAAEVDPHSRVSGGYGFSWPRDGSYLAWALGAFGFRERVEHYFEFLTRTQDPSGAWWQRYLASGEAGPSWGRIQIDEPATVIGAAYQHYRNTQDLFWLERFWPTIEKGLGFLMEFHSPEHPLGQPSHDLWEERMGIHAYSLGAVASAFHAGSYLAQELSREKQAVKYGEWGTAMAQIITEKFVRLDGPIRRSFVVGQWDYVRGGGQWDETPDVSLLGLITPFSVFNKRDAAAQRIVEQVRESLWVPRVGGVYRYPGDHYRGGHPWILTTLWLGQVELSLGHLDRARECFQWAMSKATPQGMLAEQVSKETGEPFWVIPLAWSHAMFLLFVREALDRKAEAAIWARV
jgi:glucoamylase